MLPSPFSALHVGRALQEWWVTGEEPESLKRKHGWAEDPLTEA